MNLIINEELNKMKEYLDKNITLSSEIVPYWNWGDCVKVKTYTIIDSKMVKCEYSFLIVYYKDKNNYANAPYLLHCDFDYKTGGKSYAEKYESIDDFKNSSMVKELVELYNKSKIEDLHKMMGNGEKIKVEFTKRPTLFDLDELDKEEDDNQLSIFDEIIDEVDNTDEVDLDDLMSYGVDDYYNKKFAGKCALLNKIRDELSKIPKYNEYYSKLKTYLKNKLPNKTFQESDFHDKPTYITNADMITIRGNRKQCPIYCYQMYKESFK